MYQTACGVSVEEFKRIINESESYSKAAATLGVHVKTVINWTKKLDCQKTGHRGGGAKQECLLEDILNGKHPQYPTYKLKHRLYKAGIKENKCECCGITDWMGKPISIELDHIDGNRHNHALDNLRTLCPNCHSQTDTFKSKIRGEVAESG